jgi:hypothetical protein
VWINPLAQPRIVAVEMMAILSAALQEFILNLSGVALSVPAPVDAFTPLSVTNRNSF